jgi:hypothetical protein
MLLFPLKLVFSGFTEWPDDNDRVRTDGEDIGRPQNVIESA